MDTRRYGDVSVLHIEHATYAKLLHLAETGPGRPAGNGYNAADPWHQLIVEPHSYGCWVHTDIAEDDDAEGVPTSLLAILRERSRDNARTPMQWTAGESAGFTTGNPWLAVNRNHVEINAAAQRADPDSVFAFFRALIRLRREEPAVALGDFELTDPDDETLWTFTRTLGDTRLLVAANLSRSERTVAADAWRGADLVLCNYGASATDSGCTPGVLRPWEACLFRAS